MCRLMLVFLSTLALLACQAQAQAPLPPAAAPSLPAAARPTLATALAKAQPPTQGVALAVGTDKVKLPAGIVMPGIVPTVGEVSAAYGRVTQQFGQVTAVAPPTMVLLNAAPGEPNIYAGLPALDAFTLLADSLSDSQWQAMTSAAGLSVASLTSAAQRQMFAALLSHDGQLLVTPKYAVGETWNKSDQLDLTSQIPLAHLRLGQTISLSLPPADNPNISYGDAEIPPPAGASREYEIAQRDDYGGSSDTVYGATVRAEVPNVPKRGQLDFTATSLKMVIPLDGLKTVGDLIARIGEATRTELYVDARLEKKSLTVVGPPAAPASDLLRALAFCLTGTFRQVGPAYVLTDDILGIGTRRQIWSEFEAEADALRAGPVLAASNDLYTRHLPKTLSWFGDPGAYSPEEEKTVSTSINTRDGFLPELKLPLSQLTPAQQDMARRGVAKWNSEYTEQRVTTDGMITVRPGLSVQLLMPGLAAPIDLNLNHGSTEQYFVFQMPKEQVDALEKKQQDEDTKTHPEHGTLLTQVFKPAPTSDAWASLEAANAPRRGALVHPRTAKDVDAEVAAAKTLGLNELWIDVFSGGVAHIPGSPLSSMESLPPRENDILTEALVRTKGTSIRVFPVFDLLFWGKAPPAQDVDLNILGETSAQAAARWEQSKALLPAGQETQEEVMSNPIIPDWPGVAVSPTAPDVQAELGALVKTLAARPGIAGLVWRQTDVPGYDLLPGGSDTSSLLLGYNESSRLAFLRRYHADPVDIYDVGHSATLANMDLPNFPDGGSGTESYRLHVAWVKFRPDMALDFLRTLYAAANPPGTPPAKRVRILMKQRRQGQPDTDSSGRQFFEPGWYGSWDGPLQAPPTLHTMGEDMQPGKPILPVPDAITQAHSQSQIVMMAITEESLDRMRRRLSYSQAAAHLHGALPNPRVATPFPQLSGFVLDLGDCTASGASPSEDPLTAFAAQVKPAPTSH